MSATGLAAVTLIESPRQVAAQSAPPPASVITGIARWQVLENAIVLPGTVTAARTIDVTASAPFGTVIVTRLPVREGDRVRPGRVIAEIDGRPVLLLAGRLPAYRDLHEGDTGPDVTQLQQALEHLGYADFDPPGSFGQSTSLALLLLYGNLGYQAPRYHPPATDLGTAATARRKRSAVGPLVPSVYLPKSEVVYIPTASALVVSVSAAVGSTLAPGSPVLRLAAGSPYVTGAISQYQYSQARTGMPVQIVSASPRLAASGVLTKIGLFPSAGSQGGAAEPGYPVVVTTMRALPQRLIHVRVKLTIIAAVTSGPVLTVPLAAVFAGPHGGSPYVVKFSAGGRRMRVDVFTGPTAAGLVAVQPDPPGTLRPGDRVLIGTGR